MDDRFLAPRCQYSCDVGRVVTDGSVRQKMTGTALAGILGISHWETPFTVACRLLGLAEKDISKKRAVVIGKELESVLIAYAADRYKDIGRFVPAEELFAERAGDHGSWPSDFDDPYFAGHLDGMVFDDAGESYVLEVKTTSMVEDWTEGVPEYYFWQVALYNHFMCQKDHAYVLLGIVDDATRKNTNAFVPCDNTVALFRLDIDREAVAERLEQLRGWYDTYISQNTTPRIDQADPRDTALFDHLANVAGDIDDMKVLLDRMFSVSEQISSVEQSVKSLKKVKDDISNRLKDYMSAHELNDIATGNGVVCKLSEQTSRSINEARMVEDGLDPSRYIETKTIKKLLISKQKTK